MCPNKKKYIGILVLLIILAFTSVGCSGDDATMPYGSSDYENGLLRRFSQQPIFISIYGLLALISISFNSSTVKEYIWLQN